MKLIDITSENWMEVLFLTTNESGMPMLCEEFVASCALSIVQAKYENGWITKAIEQDGQIIGFTMYGYCEAHQFYELCRILIDKKHQGRGYGTRAIQLVLDEMRSMDGCREVYLSTDPNNHRGKHIYEKIGFLPENRQIDGEDLYKIVLL